MQSCLHTTRYYLEVVQWGVSGQYLEGQGSIQKQSPPRLVSLVPASIESPRTEKTMEGLGFELALPGQARGMLERRCGEKL